MKFFLVFIFILQLLVFGIASANQKVVDVLNQYNGGGGCSKALTLVSTLENLPAHLNIEEQGKLQRAREDINEIISNTNLSDQDKSLAILGKLSSKYKKLKSLQFEDLEVFFNIDWETDKVKLESNLRSFIANNFSFLKAANRAGLYYKYINKEELDTLPGYKSELEINHGMFLLLIRRLDPSIPLTEKQVNQILNKIPKENLSLRDEIVLTIQDMYGSDYLDLLSESGKFIVVKRDQLFKKRGKTSKAMILKAETVRLKEAKWVNPDGLKTFMEERGYEYEDSDKDILNSFITYVPEDMMIASVASAAMDDLNIALYSTFKKSLNKAINVDSKLKDKYINFVTYRLVNLFTQRDFEGVNISSDNTYLYYNFLLLSNKDMLQLLKIYPFMEKKNFIYIRYIVEQYFNSKLSKSPNMREFYRVIIKKNFFPLGLAWTSYTGIVMPVIHRKKESDGIKITINGFKSFVKSNDTNKYTLRLFIKEHYEDLSMKHKKYILKHASNKLTDEMIRDLKKVDKFDDVAPLEFFNDLEHVLASEKMNNLNLYLNNLLEKSSNYEAIKSFLDVFAIQGPKYFTKSEVEDFIQTLLFAADNHKYSIELFKSTKTIIESSNLTKRKKATLSERLKKQEIDSINRLFDRDDFVRSNEYTFHHVIELVIKLPEEKRRATIEALLSKYNDEFRPLKYSGVLGLVIDNAKDLQVEDKVSKYKEKIKKIESSSTEVITVANEHGRDYIKKLLDDPQYLLQKINTHESNIVFDFILELEQKDRYAYVIYILKLAHDPYDSSATVSALRYLKKNINHLMSPALISKFMDRYTHFIIAVKAHWETEYLLLHSLEAKSLLLDILDGNVGDKYEKQNEKTRRRIEVQFKSDRYIIHKIFKQR